MLFRGITLIALILAVVLCVLTGGMWLWKLPLFFVAWFLVLGIGAFLLLLYLTNRVDLSVPQEEDDPFYRKLAILYCNAIQTGLMIRLHTKGLENVPKDGRFVLVCNHTSYLDPVLLLGNFPKSQLAFISKRENSEMFIIGKLMHKIMAQTVNRENDREALKTILKCISIIKEDKASIAVFPEGYISDDGLLRHFRSGVFKIAQKANVPIVVCTLRNTQAPFHNAPRLHRTDVDLHLVGVVPAEELKGVTAVDIGNRVYDMMANDLGPDLVYHEETE